MTELETRRKLAVQRLAAYRQGSDTSYTQQPLRAVTCPKARRDPWLLVKVSVGLASILVLATAVKIQQTYVITPVGRAVVTAVRQAWGLPTPESRIRELEAEAGLRRAQLDLLRQVRSGF